MISLLVISGVFAALALGLLVLGLLQPVNHSVTRSITLKQKPEIVFAVIDDADQLLSWSSMVVKVERLPDLNGRPRTRQTLKFGMAFIATTIERKPPSRLVGSLEREGGPLLGTWTYAITPEGDGCRVAITEEGVLKNPFSRAFARLRGLDASIRQQLIDLARKFGETTVFK
jgi:uncharacterized protein YndB with AHSA1/START domain